MFDFLKKGNKCIVLNVPSTYPARPLNGILTAGKVDSLIGEIASVCNDIPFMIISDHGFTSIKQEVYINYWLRDKGYLNFTKAPPDSLEQIDSNTKAFALDPARIYINLKGKFPRGIVESGSEYEKLRMKIKEELLALEINGSKLIRDIYTKEEIYKGTYIDRAPDLVVVGNHGYDLKGVLNKSSLFGRSIFTGAHTQDNATFFINRTINDSKIYIMDVSPTVLKLMGIKYEFFDGKPLI